MRLAPVEEKQEKNILGEIEFINYLLVHNYPALVPIKTLTGKECLKINSKWGEYYATAFKQSLGRLHSLSTKFVPKTKKWTHIEVLDWIVLDIEQVFNSIEEELSGEALQTAKNEFIRGYKEEHFYTQEMNTLLPLMRRFINLYGYARLIRCVAEKFADEPEWLVELRGRPSRSKRYKGTINTVFMRFSGD